MSKKNHRSGGKFSGSHTTLIDAGCVVADIAEKCPHCYNISPGYIKTGLPSANGNRGVKITDDEGSLLLSVRGNTSNQEIRVYTHNTQETRTAIAKGALDAGLRISFGKN